MRLPLVIDHSWALDLRGGAVGQDFLLDPDQATARQVMVRQRLAALLAVGGWTPGMGHACRLREGQIHTGVADQVRLAVVPLQDHAALLFAISGRRLLIGDLLLLVDVLIVAIPATMHLFESFGRHRPIFNKVLVFFSYHHHRSRLQGRNLLLYHLCYSVVHSREGRGGFLLLSPCDFQIRRKHIRRLLHIPFRLQSVQWSLFFLDFPCFGKATGTFGRTDLMLLLRHFR